MIDGGIGGGLPVGAWSRVTVLRAPECKRPQVHGHG